MKAEEYTTFLAEDSQDKMHPENSRWLISIPVGAIFVSTFVMALLETCLPMWLLETMHPEVRINMFYYAIRALAQIVVVLLLCRNGN